MSVKQWLSKGGPQSNLITWDLLEMQILGPSGEPSIEAETLEDGAQCPTICILTNPSGDFDFQV